MPIIIRACAADCKLSGIRSQLHGFDQFLGVFHAALEHLAFGVVQLDFDDSLDALGAQNRWNADEKSADIVFLVAVGGTGKNALFVLNDRFGHLHGGGGGGVIGAAGLQ